MKNNRDVLEFRIKLAGYVVSAAVNYCSTKAFCKAFQTEEKPDIFVTITCEDISYERKIAARKDAQEGLTVRNLPDALLEVTALQRKITEELLLRDILLFHGSVVAVDGDGYLFTAKSGTGKSTHTRLWREQLGDRAAMVNDDKPFLQITDSGVVAWGSPWNGKHRLGDNICAPLKAICILERSETNKIGSVSAQEALKVLFQQSYRPENPANRMHYMDLIGKLATRVDLFRMGCNMDPEAALVSYTAMSRERKEEEK